MPMVQHIIQKYWSHVVSFVALMILGFFYNRYQDKITREEGLDNNKAIPTELRGEDYLSARVSVRPLRSAPSVLISGDPCSAPKTIMLDGAGNAAHKGTAHPRTGRLRKHWRQRCEVMRGSQKDRRSDPLQ